MVRRILTSLVLSIFVGCGASEPPAATVPEGRETPAVPPAEIRMMLEGLRSEHPRMQYAALENLGRFPSVVKTYREHVERLQKEGNHQQVRQKAAELLDSLEAVN